MELILMLAVAALLLWFILGYNSLVQLRNQVQNAWKQIDVQLKRRHDLIPNLVETVKGYMKFEQETLQKVMEARAKAVRAAGVRETAESENQLTQTLGRLFALMENYPELKSNENALKLQEELTSTENRIGFARQFYNDLVMRFNTKQEVLPSNLIASLFGFQRADYFEIEAPAREVPKVDLSVQ
ncbi:MAG: LemA family protein [Acidobacteria bacterium]|nr:LemA family protein [Acidobacteriota bacterium]